jgi:phasin family protein
MTKNPFFDNWMKTDFAKNLSQGLQNPFAQQNNQTAETVFNKNNPAQIDMRAMMEQGRKAFQAMTEAQQLCMEGFQTIAQRQAEIISELMQDQSAVAREMMAEGTPEEKIARGAEMTRRAYEKTAQGMREMGDILNKSSREAGDIIHRRVASTLNEIRDQAEERAGQTAKKQSRASSPAAENTSQETKRSETPARKKKPASRRKAA